MVDEFGPEITVIKWLGGLLVAIFAWIFKDVYARVKKVEEKHATMDTSVTRLTSAIENQNTLLSNMDRKMDRSIEKSEDAIDDLRESINKLNIMVAKLPKRAGDRTEGEE